MPQFALIQFVAAGGSVEPTRSTVRHTHNYWVMKEREVTVIRIHNPSVVEEKAENGL